VLTRAGVSVLVGSVVLGVAGRILGILELYVLAAAGLGLVVIALATVHWRPPTIEVERAIRPARVHAGTTSRVELTVSNRGLSRSPVLAIDDDVSGTAGAHLMVAPIHPNASVSATYRLPTEGRGVVAIGPLALVQPDPFGLARRVQRIGLPAELTVLPRVIDLLPLPQSRGHDPVSGTDQPDHLGRAGEDFYGLRPYVVGDDLRRVHWLSTARSGDLLVRQDEQPRLGRVMIVLDNRRGAADPATFELMVVAAASVVAACRRRGDVVRLRTTSPADSGSERTTGFDTGYVTGRGQADSLMERLAVVDLEAATAWPSALAKDTGATAGSIVTIVGDIGPTDLDAIVASRPRVGDLTVLRLGRGARHAPVTASGRDLARHRVRFVDVGDERDLEAVWNGSVAKATLRRP
jgi:hypothetical protein